MTVAPNKRRCYTCGTRANCDECKRRAASETAPAPRLRSVPQEQHDVGESLYDLLPDDAPPLTDDDVPPEYQVKPDPLVTLVQSRHDLHVARQQVSQITTPDDEASSWRPHDIAAVVEGGHEPPPPLLLRRDDGQALFYAGKVNDLHGESESAKSWIAQYGTAQELIAGNVALYVDFEDDAANVVARLRALGTPLDLLVANFIYMRPHERLDEAAFAELRAALDRNPTIAVVDGVTDAMTLHGLNPLSNEDVSKFMAMLPKFIARRGPGVGLIDHVTKDKETRGRYAIGAQHKLAAIDGASYYVEAVESFGRGQTGITRLTVAKDRGGWVRRLGSKIAAEFHFTANDVGDGVKVKVLGESAAVEPKEWNGPSECMEAVREVLRARAPEELSTSALLAAMRGLGHRFRDKTVTEALERLARRGDIDQHRGARNAYLYAWPKRDQQPTDEGEA